MQADAILAGQSLAFFSRDGFLLVSGGIWKECALSFLGIPALLLDLIHTLAASLLPQHGGPAADRQFEPEAAPGIPLSPVFFWKEHDKHLNCEAKAEN